MTPNLQKRKRWNIAIARETFSAKDLELLETEYRSVHTPMAYRCRACSHKGKLRFNDIQSKNCGCKNCGVKRRAEARRLNFKDFKRQQLKKGFEILSNNYVNVETKLPVRHIECGYEWMVRPHCLLSGRGCPKCRRQKQSERQLYSAEYVASELAKRGITLLSVYEGSQKPIFVRFNTCGHEIERTYNQLSRLPKCGRCAPNARATEEDYHATAKTFGGQLLRAASSVHLPSLWRCPLGKHEFERSLASIRKLGTFCTICAGAYGEILCQAAIVKLFGMPFRKKRVPGMKSPKGRLLEFDIYNERLRIAVEHHGAHHYRAMPHWSGVEGLNRQRVHDDLRRQFCKANRILLIEIRELGIQTSMEEMRQQIRAALLEDGLTLPLGFDETDLTNLPQLNASQVYWAEVHEAAEKIGLKILSRVFQGAEMPISVQCEHGHITQKTPRSILQGHRCDDCYMEQRRKPVRLSDGRLFESGTAAAKMLGVRKETVNAAVRNKRRVKGFKIERISLEQFSRSRPSRVRAQTGQGGNRGVERRGG